MGLRPTPHAPGAPFIHPDELFVLAAVAAAQRPGQLTLDVGGAGVPQPLAAWAEDLRAAGRRLPWRAGHADLLRSRGVRLDVLARARADAAEAQACDAPERSANVPALLDGLASGPVRFHELRRRLGGPHPLALLELLRKLERSGVVRRRRRHGPGGATYGLAGPRDD